MKRGAIEAVHEQARLVIMDGFGGPRSVRIFRSRATPRRPRRPPEDTAGVVLRLEEPEERVCSFWTRCGGDPDRRDPPASYPPRRARNSCISACRKNGFSVESTLARPRAAARPRGVVAVDAPATSRNREMSSAAPAETLDDDAGGLALPECPARASDPGRLDQTDLAGDFLDRVQGTESWSRLWSP